ncbi:LamG-like jellyroll fold domain-containing protein [Archangium violaceum]|uniref:LamG-like jellyroll fold domain-containing protein n=1 Tax=Archangium violaceum TaxID=83451 RepID=UPI0036D7B6DA
MQRFLGRPLSSFWVACLFWLSVSSLLVPAAQAQSMAAGVSWKGHVDTNLGFSEFFAADHTYVLRFMPQFPNAYEGPFIAENGGGRLLIGQGDYAGSGTKLLLAVGSASRSYPVTLKAGEWHHLAVVATTSGSTRSFTVYLNGAALSSPLSVQSTDAQLPSGTLRFGKRTTGQTVNGRNAQFYGFLDDVAVFNRALSASEIQYLMTNVPQLTGSESGLLAGYTFNQGTLPAKLARPVTFQGSARRIAVSSNRSNAVDAPDLPLPTQQVEMTLPFKTGEAWLVIQGYDDAAGSHKGYASFCWDFVLADKPQNAVYPNGSDGAPLYTAAPGSVVTVDQSSVSGTGNRSNMIEIEQAPGELAGYLHIRKDSAEVSLGGTVTRGQKVALTGDTGVGVGAHHLHLATTDMRDGTAGFVTFPVVFSNYEVRDALGTWKRVFRGIPQPGQVVRVPANPTARYTAVWQRTTVGEHKVEGVRYADFRAAYDELWPEGWRLHQLQSYVVSGQVLYNAVWRPGTESEVQVYGWSYQDFRAKYDELYPQGWRLHLLQSYVVNNQVLYNAVWRPGTSGEVQVYGWSYQDFRAKYDELYPQGWRLHLLQSYVVNNQVLYNAVWRPGTSGEVQVYGWSYQDFRNKYDELWPLGWRLHLLQSYVLNGQVLYNAVWRPSTASEVQVYGWSYQDFRNKYDELWAQGWRLKLLDAYQP